MKLIIILLFLSLCQVTAADFTELDFDETYELELEYGSLTKSEREEIQENKQSGYYDSQDKKNVKKYKKKLEEDIMNIDIDDDIIDKMSNEELIEKIREEIEEVQNLADKIALNRDGRRAEIDKIKASLAQEKEAVGKKGSVYIEENMEIERKYVEAEKKEWRKMINIVRGQKVQIND